MKKKYQEKWENAYLTAKNAKASRALRWALDPGQYWLDFARPTPLRYVGKISEKISGPPLDQILDPLVKYVGFEKIAVHCCASSFQILFVIFALILFCRCRLAHVNRHSVHNSSGKSEIKHSFCNICFHYGTFYWRVHLAIFLQKVTGCLHMERCIYIAGSHRGKQLSSLNDTNFHSSENQNIF